MKIVQYFLILSLIDAKLPDGVSQNVVPYFKFRPRSLLSPAVAQPKWDKTPVLGPIPSNGTKPIHGRHKGTDAIFALACKYPLQFYKRFVGTLRKFGFTEDIVLAVSPPDQMKAGVEDYVIKTEVVAYAFDVDCAGKDNCRFKPDFLG